MTCSPITLPAHASLFTGLYPPRHGVRNNGDSVLRAEHETLAEVLRAADYATAAFPSSIVLDSRYALDQGFEVYDDGYAMDTSSNAFGGKLERSAREVTDDALAWLATRDERPFLLWCGAGFDAVLIDELNTSRTGHMGLTGLVRHTPRVLRALARYPVPPIRTEIDGHSVEDASSVLLTNVAKVGLGGTVIDTADPFDGQLDVVAIDPAPWPKLVRLGLRMLTTGLRGAHGARHQLATHVRLSAEGTVPVQLDGEPVGTLPISVGLRAGAIRLLLT